MSHEVAVNAGAVNGTELNGAHTTEETLALVTPVEVEERSGLAAVEVCGVIRMWGKNSFDRPILSGQRERFSAGRRDGGRLSRGPGSGPSWSCELYILHFFFSLTFFAHSAYRRLTV